MSTTRGRTGTSHSAFLSVAGSLGVVLLASTAPSPLYGIYQQRWQFTSTLLTVVFAAYAIVLLLTLLLLGRLSDHVGRRRSCSVH